MAAHAKAIGIWWLATMAALTTAVIAVVLVVQADSGEASPPPPSPLTAPSTDAPGTTSASP
ncbi:MULTISPECIES: hypothetical protein [Streptomyces]|uniref:hypothetical protein n=1 Tax=Streptomyces TaxID=1883 RepID=UPI000B5C9680|nr:hypothetical protein [Streptomyces hyaluromycini]